MKRSWPIPLVAALCLSGCPEDQAAAIGARQCLGCGQAIVDLLARKQEQRLLFAQIDGA